MLKQGLRFATCLILGISVVGGAIALRPALHILQLRLAADDPVALTDLRLSEVLTAARVEQEIDEAVAAEDEELANGLVNLARDRNITIDDTHLARIRQLANGAAVRRIRRFGSGFASGEGEDLAAISGAFAGDLVGYGDVRDLWREGGHYLANEPYDEVVAGLAVIGLASSAAAIGSLGATTPARIGLTVAKIAKKVGRLSRGLIGTVRRLVVDTVDQPALRRVFASARRMDVTGTRQAAAEAVRPGALARLQGFGSDLGTLASHAGQRGALQAVGLAESSADVSKLARVAERFGEKSRAVFKVVGRGILGISSLTSKLIAWALAALAWLLAVALFIWRAVGLAADLIGVARGKIRSKSTASA